MEKTVTMAIVDLRKDLLNVVNNSGLPPAISSMVLHELVVAVDDAARQQYEKEVREAEEKTDLSVDTVDETL